MRRREGLDLSQIEEPLEVEHEEVTASLPRDHVPDQSRGLAQRLDRRDAELARAGLAKPEDPVRDERARPGRPALHHDEQSPCRRAPEPEPEVERGEHRPANVEDAAPRGRRAGHSRDERGGEDLANAPHVERAAEAARLEGQELHRRGA
jgi:hypothetical protein